MMKNTLTVRNLIVSTSFLFFVGCAYVPESVNFSKPIKTTRLSEQAWVIDIGKALDRPSRYKLSRVEAAKAAQRIGCEYFKADSLLNEQFSTFEGQRVYRCASEDSQPVFVTAEVLRLETL